MRRSQRRTSDYSLHEAVMHKVDSLARAIEEGRIPRRKVYGALINAMGSAFSHGMTHGIKLIRGLPDRETKVLVVVATLLALCAASVAAQRLTPEEALKVWTSSTKPYVYVHIPPAKESYIGPPRRSFLDEPMQFPPPPWKTDWHRVTTFVPRHGPVISVFDDDSAFAWSNAWGSGGRSCISCPNRREYRRK